MSDNKRFDDEMANYFAMCILMPEKEFRKVFEENLSNDRKTVNTGAIAKHFGVTISEACTRAVDLGLIRGW